MTPAEIRIAPMLACKAIGTVLADWAWKAEERARRTLVEPKGLRSMEVKDDGRRDDDREH